MGIAVPGDESTGSLGIVQPHLMSFAAALELEAGQTLPGFALMYETYGELNRERSNAVLICHALSGHHHAAGYHSREDTKPGWWDLCIGPGKPIDTNHLFVVSSNNLGGCHGSTGPSTTNPATDKPYGADFPTVTVRDWVKTQAMLADRLQIKCWAAVLGGSLGGMQALQWAIDYPDRLGHAILIACAPHLSAQNIAFNEIARNAIQSDPNFHGGHYRDHGAVPNKGLMQARMVGHVTYLSEDGMRLKFGRSLHSGDWEKSPDVQFQVESYLRYQGNAFSEQFDANTYVLMTKALDSFDPARAYGGDLARALTHTQCAFLLIAFTTDWRFSAERSQEIVDALVQAGKPVSSLVIASSSGHDSFLLNIPRYTDALRAYVERRLIRPLRNTQGKTGKHAP